MDPGGGGGGGSIRGTPNVRQTYELNDQCLLSDINNQDGYRSSDPAAMLSDSGTWLSSRW